MIARLWRMLGFLAGPIAIVCTAVILAGTPSRPSDQGPVDPNNVAPQRTENLPATQPAAAFH